MLPSLRTLTIDSAVLLLVVAAATATLIWTTGGDPAQLNSDLIAPKQYEITDLDSEWTLFDSRGGASVDYYVKSTMVTSFEFWAAGTFPDARHPVVIVQWAGGEHRLDCESEAAAKKIIDHIIQRQSQLRESKP